MLIEQEFALEAPRDEVAAFFLDIDRVSACIPGVEDVEEVGPHTYSAVLALRLGPIRAAFKGTLTLDDEQAPARFVATGEGRDRATGSVAKVAFTADLQEDGPARTVVTSVADLSLRGRMSQFGTGVVRAAAGEMVKEFATRANQALAQPAAEPPTATSSGVPAAEPATAATSPRPAPASPRPSPRSRGLLSVVLRGLLGAVVQAVRGWLPSRRTRKQASR